MQKFYDALRSQGISVGKDTLCTFLGYLEDTFLVRVVALHTASERQRMVHPRRIYPVDPGLIPVYERSGRLNLDAVPPQPTLPAPLQWQAAAGWLLGDM